MPAALIDTLRAVDRALRGCFTWRRDSDQFGVVEDWRDHAAEVRAGRVFADDCDGWAMTAARLLAEDHGVDPARLWLAVCKTERGEGHAVCLAVDDDGAWYAIDNRQRGVTDATKLRYDAWRGVQLGDAEKQWRVLSVGARG